MPIITVHGFNFVVESDGFIRRRAQADFDNGVAAIEGFLTKMSAGDVAAIHAADLAWQDRECEGERPSVFNELECLGVWAATIGWHRPNPVIFMVSATS